MPHEDLERENIRRNEMLASMGMHSAMEVDTAAPSGAAPALLEQTEIGSSPTCFMDSVETPARLRGGGARGGDVVECALSGVGESRRSDLLAVRLTLRGGGNVLSIGTKYSAKEYALNKQLCGAVKKGWVVRSIYKHPHTHTHTHTLSLSLSLSLSLTHTHTHAHAHAHTHARARNRLLWLFVG